MLCQQIEFLWSLKCDTVKIAKELGLPEFAVANYLAWLRDVWNG